MLDAGHGGKDPGTVNGRNYEKTINLAVVKAVGEILSNRDDLKIVYTRSDDRFVELSERSRIATRARADLFVSVHTNASPSKKACGTETYIMGVDKSNANLGVAMRENGVISLENDYTTAYEGYDPSSSESLIMFSLMQYSFSRESLEIASAFQKNYKSAGRRDNGVRQAGFLVLWRNTMPSVLTELGYLSNEQEAKYLLSKAGQVELAKAIAQGVESYVDACTDNPCSKKIANDPQVATTPKPTPKPAAQSDIEIDEVVVDDDFVAECSAFYAVQVRSASAAMPINSSNFGPLVTQISERKIENLYKYTVGSLVYYKDALLLQDKIRKIYPDAFIVAYDDAGRQISVRDARKLIENK